MAMATAAQKTNPNPYRVILLGGLIAGICDISAAFINSGLRGRSPMWVLQSVASGLLGADSYTGGIRSAALGLVVHFSIATVWCAVYYAASRRLALLVRRALVCGLLYGIAVYFFMYLVVLPLTFHRSFMTPLSAVLTSLLIHMFCVGLPIALVVRWQSK